MNRRSFLKILGASAAVSATGSSVMHALASDPPGSNDCFIIIHASGGWDVTTWADPRNEHQGLINAATTAAVDPTGVRHWKGKALGDGIDTFELIQKNGFALGPAFGGLIDRFDRVSLINGIAMDTVSHADGTYYSSTGRHLAGGRPLQTSIDTLLAGELGPADLLPLVSVRFPSTFLSTTLDARAMPLRMASVSQAGRSLLRADTRTYREDRDAVTTLLAHEAADLALQSYEPAPADGLRLQYDALQRMLGDRAILDTFEEAKLRGTLQPKFFVDGEGKAIVRRSHQSTALNAAFAVEAIKKNMVRCVSFSATGFDMHGTEYEDSLSFFQEFFDVIALLIDRLDAEGLSDRVHVMVVSDFCRTPQITARGGRDHYPNNSSIIISPKFKAGRVFGETDHAQLLPKNVLSTPLGPRPIRPSDVLATFLSSFGIEPRKHLRDGDVVSELLK